MTNTARGLSACLFLVVLAMAVAPASGDWQLFADPPDVDKQRIWDTTWDWWNRDDRSCWMASAANLLASAGYGFGATIQERGEDIYRDLIVWQDINVNNAQDGFFTVDGRYYGDGLDDGGWTHTAVDWWLASPHNVWKKQHTHVAVSRGVHYDRSAPWANADLPM